MTCQLCDVAAFVVLDGKRACANHTFDVFTREELKRYATEGSAVHQAEREQAARNPRGGCC